MYDTKCIKADRFEYFMQVFYLLHSADVIRNRRFRVVIQGEQTFVRTL